MKTYRQLAREYRLTPQEVSTIVRVLGVEPVRVGQCLAISERQEREIAHALQLIGRREPAKSENHSRPVTARVTSP